MHFIRDFTRLSTKVMTPSSDGRELGDSRLRPSTPPPPSPSLSPVFLSSSCNLWPPTFAMSRSAILCILCTTCMALILFLSPASVWVRLYLCLCRCVCVCAAGIYKLTVSSANFTQLALQKQEPSSSQLRKWWRDKDEQAASGLHM